mmetsp:Transcript_56412/g.175420  ORF Transcript_56412/g.175420 Transcript_56412/m.175420 type:complete len:287 (-) Transcript_56412:1019-1879(-)
MMNSRSLPLWRSADAFRSVVLMLKVPRLLRILSVASLRSVDDPVSHVAAALPLPSPNSVRVDACRSKTNSQAEGPWHLSSCGSSLSIRSVSAPSCWLVALATTEALQASLAEDSLTATPSDFSMRTTKERGAMRKPSELTSSTMRRAALPADRSQRASSSGSLAGALTEGVPGSGYSCWVIERHAKYSSGVLKACSPGTWTLQGGLGGGSDEPLRLWAASQAPSFRSEKSSTLSTPWRSMHLCAKRSSLHSAPVWFQARAVLQSSTCSSRDLKALRDMTSRAPKKP